MCANAGSYRIRPFVSLQSPEWKGIMKATLWCLCQERQLFLSFSKIPLGVLWSNQLALASGSTNQWLYFLPFTPFFRATQLRSTLCTWSPWLSSSAGCRGPEAPTSGFPRWKAECSSQSLSQPAVFLHPSGRAVSGWMPMALAHSTRGEQMGPELLSSQGTLRRPATGTHRLWFVYQGKVTEILMRHHMPAQHLLSHIRGVNIGQC